MIDTKRLRQKILDLAIRGKLVPQNPNDEPASVLLARIHAEKLQMVAGGKLKKKDVAGDSVIYRGEDNLHYEKVGDGEPVCIEDELPFGLPEGWCWSRLDSFTSASGGKTPSTANRLNWDNGTIPWITSKDMKAPVLYSSRIMMTERAARKMSMVPADSVLIVTRSGILRRTLPVAINKMETTVNQDIKALSPYVEGLSQQVFLALTAQESRLLSKFSKDGTTVESIDFDRLYRMPIPIPPLAEQRRIGATLDDLLARVDTIEREQAELDELLAKTRSKVLDLAIRGKLVSQDPADEPASVLLERIHQEKLQMVADGKLKKKDVAGDSVIYRGDDNSYYERSANGKTLRIDGELFFEIPKDWCWSRLSSLASASGGKTPSTVDHSNWDGGTVPWITSKDMKVSELYSSQIMMTESAAKTMSMVPADSVLIVTRSGILRRTLPVAINKMETTVNQDIKALSPYVEGLSQQVFLALTAQESRLLRKFSKDGTTVESIDFDRLYRMPIPIPPLAEQRRIWAAICELLALDVFGSGVSTR